MEEIYKGYKIEYQEFNRTFQATIGNATYSNLLLEKVKKYIDNLDRKDFKRTNVMFSHWSDDYIFGTVTSEVPNDDNVWISYKDKHRGSTRTKVSIKSVFLDNPHNKTILEQIILKQKDIEILHLEISKCQEDFEHYKKLGH